MVSRQEAWRYYYSRYLLNELGADPGRLAAVAEQFRAELQRTPTERELSEDLPPLWASAQSTLPSGRRDRARRPR